MIFFIKVIRRVKGVFSRLYRVLVLFFFILKRRDKIKNFKVEQLLDVNPVLIQGMFRSGTSLTSSLVCKMGIDFGEEDHLIKAIGNAKDLNPKGFYEHYFFAAVSRYFHHITNSSGDKPASKNIIDKVTWDSIDWKKLLYYSIVRINDTRVSLKNKLQMWDKVFSLGFEEFIHTEFDRPFAVKMPMLALYSKQLLEIFPQAVIIVVFRNPFSVVESAKRITKNSSLSLYYNYHIQLSTLDEDLDNTDILFYSYDSLITNPCIEVDKLYKFLSKHYLLPDKRKKALAEIDINLFRSKSSKSIEELPDNVRTTFNILNAKANR